MRSLRNLKARTLFILFGVMVVIDILLIILFMKINNKNLSTVVLIISFLLTTMFLNGAIFKVFEYKHKKYNTVQHKFKGLEYMHEALNDFTINRLNYGTVYSKVIDKCAYKITYISDYKLYQEQEEKETYAKTPGIDKAKWMVGLEIFMGLNDDLEKKLPLYSLSGEKLYYEGFYLDNDNIISLDHVEPLSNMADKVNKIYERIGIYEEEINN